MSSLEVLTGRNYLSHSSLTSWLKCGEQFRLERVAGAPQGTAWYLVGGSAVHKASELLDKGEQTDLLAAWKLAWDECYADDITSKGILPLDVRAGGRASKEWPNKENADWWQVNGPVMLQQYIAWRDARFSEGWQWLQLPDGSPAVELGIQLELGGVLVKGFIDRVMVNDAGELIVVDLKTGSHTPASTLQLAIYALGVERHLGVLPILGGYYMARKAELSGPSSLLHYTPELVGKWFAQAKAGIEAEIFVPQPSSLCGSCTVRQYCTAFPQPLDVPGFSSSIATSH